MCRTEVIKAPLLEDQIRKRTVTNISEKLLKLRSRYWVLLSKESVPFIFKTLAPKMNIVEIQMVQAISFCLILFNLAKIIRNQAQQMVLFPRDYGPRAHSFTEFTANRLKDFLLFFPLIDGDAFAEPDAIISI